MAAPDNETPEDLAHSTAGPPGEASDPFATCAMPERTVSASEQRYTILRTLQQGGLGLVSVARDEDFNREVAFKEILPASADDDHNRQRFVREAEITGALEHPGVVPVYSLGHYDDGRPYYAMRFVHGVDMQQAIDAFHFGTEKNKELKFRQLLGRFVDVCQTINYAHSRGVLHRDLKPSNIMLGEYGETLVVDWGLAKASGESASIDDIIAPPVALSGSTAADMTAAGRAIGTPIYMSPEQAEGRVDMFGVTTDVYCLGATLYHLLTGHPPFDPNQSNLLAQVRAGAVVSADKRAPDAPKSLAAIASKAMALKQGERYQSAGDLGLEVERWLADEPVTAFKDPLSVRFWRWVRRRRALVLSLATAAVVALAALSLGIAMLSSANAKITAAKDQADENLKESVLQRQRAEKNAATARRAVRDYFVRVSEETLLSQPGMQPLRNDLLTQALTYYQQFLEESSDDPKLRAEVATALYYVGKITQVLQGPEAALEHLGKAAEIQDALLMQDDSSDAVASDLGRTLNAMGAAHQRLSQPDEAVEFYEQAIELRQQLAEAKPESAERARQFASSVMNVGQLFASHRMWEEALHNLRQAQSIRSAHIASDGSAPLALQRDLGKGCYNLARALDGAGHAEEAVEQLRKAVVHFHAVEAAEPGDVASDDSLATCFRALGDIQAGLDKPDQAIDAFREAAKRVQNLVVRNPGVPKFVLDLAGVRMNLGELLSTLDQTDQALEEIAAAITLLRTPEGQEPLPRRRRDLGAALRFAGQLHAALGERDRAIERLKESQQVLKQLVREHPGQQEYSSELLQTNQAMNEAEKLKAAPKEEKQA